jgi:hypothetical protein
LKNVFGAYIWRPLEYVITLVRSGFSVIGDISKTVVDVYDSMSKWLSKLKLVGVFASALKRLPFLNVIFGVLDFFKGFAKGFEMTGKFKCIGGIDNKVSAIQTHKHNFKDSISICEDIRKVSPEYFEKLLKGQKVDLIIGGPPCPTFSTIGHAKIQSVYKSDKNKDITNDPRNDLFLDFFSYVDHFRPKMFVMENVPQFLTKYNGATFNAVAGTANTGGGGGGAAWAGSGANAAAGGSGIVIVRYAI